MNVQVNLRFVLCAGVVGCSLCVKATCSGSHGHMHCIPPVTALEVEPRPRLLCNTPICLYLQKVEFTWVLNLISCIPSTGNEIVSFYVYFGFKVPTCLTSSEVSCLWYNLV